MSASTTDEIPLEQAPGLGEHALNSLTALRHLFGDSFRLFGLEARLAGLSLAGIMIAALTAAFSLMATWLLLQAVAVLALMRLGIDPLALLGLFTLINAGAGLGLLLLIRRLSRNLLFKATGRAIKGGPHAPAA